MSSSAEQPVASRIQSQHAATDAAPAPYQPPDRALHFFITGLPASHASTEWNELINRSACGGVSIRHSAAANGDSQLRDAEVADIVATALTGKYPDNSRSSSGSPAAVPPPLQGSLNVRAFSNSPIVVEHLNTHSQLQAKPCKYQLLEHGTSAAQLLDVIMSLLQSSAAGDVLLIHIDASVYKDHTAVAAIEHLVATVYKLIATPTPKNSQSSELLARTYLALMTDHLVERPSRPMVDATDSVQQLAVLLIPPQSHESVDATYGQAAKHPTMYCLPHITLHPNTTRQDAITHYDSLQIVAHGCNGMIANEYLFAELAFKLGRKKKYGA